MGSSSREKPKNLANKLLQIRKSLNLTQVEMVAHLGYEKKLRRVDISKYELGVREPNLLVLLEYARAAGVSTDVLIDDQRDLDPKR